MYIDVKTYYVKGIAKLNSYVHLSLLQPYNNLTIIISININPDNSRHVVKYAHSYGNAPRIYRALIPENNSNNKISKIFTYFLV